MRSRSLMVSGLGALGVFASVAFAEVPVDQITVAKLPAPTPYRLYLSDVAIPHIVDGKLLIIDGGTLKVQGMVSTAFAGAATLAPDRSEIYVAATYFTRLNRGERIDQVDVYDATTLKLKTEILIPTKRAEALPYRGYVRVSENGRFIFVQNATPATSVSIVDRDAEKFVAEIPTPGCWAIFTPKSSSNRFSTLCGDGTMLTVMLDEKGNPVSRKKSPKFFDPDDDALFIVGERVGDQYAFVSFKGNIQQVDIGGEEAVAHKPWPLVTGIDIKQGWRPGGYQPLAIHEKSGKLYVAVHRKGVEGSHKNPADEVWVFDFANHKRILRTKGKSATTMAVTQGDAPRLFLFDGTKAALHALDATPRQGKLKVLASGGPFGETPTQLDTQ